MVITVSELSSIIKSNPVYILDVRNPDEYEFCNIGGVNIPLGILHEEFEKIDKSLTVYCLCHHGVRSAMAQDFLLSKGYTDVINIEGGIDAWSIEIDPSIARY